MEPVRVWHSWPARLKKERNVATLLAAPLLGSIRQLAEAKKIFTGKLRQSAWAATNLIPSLCRMLAPQ